MTEQFDHDGDAVSLTDEDRANIQEELSELDALISQSDASSSLWRELTDQRNHLQAEFDAGRRLVVGGESQ